VGWQTVLDNYVDYLATHRGFSDGGQGYGCLLRRLVAFLEQRQVLSPESCTIGDLDAWIADLATRPLTAKTLYDYVTVLRGFLKYLHGEGHMTSRLWTDLEAPRVWRETTVPEHYSWAEVGELISRVQSDPRCDRRDIALLWLLAGAGLRPGEAARLRLVDIDWTEATVLLWHRKRQKPLLVPLLPAMVAALRAYIDTERPTDSAHQNVFLTDDDGPYRSGTEVSLHIQSLASRVGVGQGRTAYALRRGLGVRLLESGAGLGQIALILGHDDTRSTRTYVRASMAQLKEVADNYANLL
jgi:site-specific recombinase XerD